MSNRKKALWDVDAERAIKTDLEVISKYFNDALPIIDFGCGTGTQSAYLTLQFDKVLAIDVSQTAIEQAKNLHSNEHLEFRTINHENDNFYNALNVEFGDCNIYMRGVIHQIKDEDLRSFNENLKTLMGLTGKLYFIEVANHIFDYFSKASDSFSKLPSAMKQTFLSHLPPRGLDQNNLSHFFDPELFKTLYYEPTFLKTNLVFKDDNEIKIPAFRGVLEPLN